MIFVDLKVIHTAQESFNKLVGGLDSVKPVKRDRVHDAGIICVKGDNIVYAHAHQFLKRDGAVERFSGGALVLAALIEIGHDHGDPARLAADRCDHSLEVLIVIVGGHVVGDPEHFVGLTVIYNICKEIEIHSADRLGKHAFAFTGTETGKITVNDIRWALVTDISDGTLVLTFALRSPTGEIVIDLGSHLLAALDGNDPQGTCRY